MSVNFPSQGFSIIFRQSSLMLASLSGASRPIQIAPIDLLLLHHALCEQDVNKSIETCLQEPFAKVTAKGITASQAANRLKHLAPVLTTKFDVSDEHASALRNVEKQQPSSVLKTSDLYLSMHHSVYLSDKGLVAWSPRQSAFVILTGIEAIFLFAFSNTPKADANWQYLIEVSGSEVAAESILESLFATGLLIAKTEIVAPKEELLQPFSTTTEAAVENVRDWHEIEADGRIPVYFVPHMENHFPLALGVLFNALRVHDNGELLKRFVLVPINFLEPTDLINGPYRKFGTGVWLFSNYMWSIDLNMQISGAVKQHNPFNFTIHGGPSTPDYPKACEDFLRDNSSVDIAVHGEGEVTITEIFDTLQRLKDGRIGFDQYALSQVGGLTFRDTLANKPIRTGSRERMKTPDSVPSPYLSGVFDLYQGRVEAAIIETNRGCPYGCTFCDWGSATNQKIRKFDLERVFDEITWIGKNKVKVIWIADANYGLYERDIEISKHIVETKQKYGYPQEVVVNYTKNSTWRLVEIIKVFNAGGIISQGIISIQTTDEKTLEVINRKNIRTERYDELAEVFSEQQLPLSTDLMIGLPGITVDAFMQDLQRYIDMDVSVKAYPTQLLPNSPMADPEYIEKYQIKVDAHNFLISTYSYTEDELKWMKAVFQVHMMADGYGLLRYVMRFLQWEYNIKAMDFLQNLLTDVRNNPRAYPLLGWAVNFFNTDKCVPGGWNAFYTELTDYLSQRYQVKQNSALEVVMAVSKASMPDDGLTYPFTVTLAHDFTAYFANAKSNFKSLDSYEPGIFQVSDPNMLVSIDLNAAQYDSHQYFWELQSDVARPKSTSDFGANRSEVEMV